MSRLLGRTPNIPDPRVRRMYAPYTTPFPAQTLRQPKSPRGQAHLHNSSPNQEVSVLENHSCTFTLALRSLQPNLIGRDFFSPPGSLEVICQRRFRKLGGRGSDTSFANRHSHARRKMPIFFQAC